MCLVSRRSGYVKVLCLCGYIGSSRSLLPCNGSGGSVGGVQGKVRDCGVSFSERTEDCKSKQGEQNSKFSYLDKSIVRITWTKESEL